MNAPFTFLILTLFHLKSLVKETLSGTTLRLEKFSRAARKLEIGTSVIATLGRRWKMLFQSIDPSWLQGLAVDCLGGVLKREFLRNVLLATCFRRANQSLRVYESKLYEETEVYCFLMLKNEQRHLRGAPAQP